MFGKISHHFLSRLIVMRKEFKNYEEALEILETFCAEWKNTIKIQNSLWVKGLF